ncbi:MULTISPECIES: hypothetical protein [unclassified Clostridioides]|uniref:hypothetical protein n=1 Tax=unclassified Clostridioides TaxID=2635829 RepID=UPI001D0BF61A|nr:hypothetical protein [Clostridioides sp. ES-S-0001-02]MCC0639842.1 hypothetical protein [Clostridioides sp. ES-S-0049-03]MCC0653589.1 hypothetical protein [Clostridioides sp. ES-S-0001-03]MCC0655336.1 hypothetical protein [Clostridioides sp. ES-S-0123-01]MCC0671311.1 hypothetical protein [Clostridioides sp. ES-S-0145-01]MCC0674881.1 hypothetical protein [Clostridioides sp. ES-W-0018-02]MCC0679411.1 hypothetical protein [Clostridioides sp. ES-S-0005-03]MCC0696494.1 hypothetical protein [Cl
MKLLKLIIVSGLMMLFVTGCNVKTESPEQLAKIPNYDDTKKVLYDGIDQLLKPDSSMILPSNTKEVGKINKVDLNSDGVDELVVFEQKEDLSNNVNKVGFVTLSYNGEKYVLGDHYLENGESIEYANFYDLDSDGYKEVILLVKSKDKTNMHIYKVRDNEITKVYDLDASWIQNKEDFNDMKVKIGYIDGDDKIDILMLHLNNKTNEMFATVANFDGTMKVKDYVKFENVKNLNELYITLGNVASSVGNSAASIKGVVLDIPMLKENNYITQILYMKNDKIQKVFSDYDKTITKPYYIPVDDVDKDKIIEIPIVAGGNRNTYTSKASANISWYRWNGKEDSNSKLIFISQIYYNYKYNFRLFMQNNLVDKIIVEQEFVGEKAVFKFYYFDYSERKNLFNIIVESKNKLEDRKSANTQNSIVLQESDEYTFLLTINDANEMDKLDITIDALKEYFSLIYG